MSDLRVYSKDGLLIARQWDAPKIPKRGGVLSTAPSRSNAGRQRWLVSEVSGPLQVNGRDTYDVRLGNRYYGAENASNRKGRPVQS
jgi:hypothetical protein